MEKFGLIGRTLKHSYSKKIHALLGDYVYDLIELEPESVADFAKNGGYTGYNVTIPYKKDIMPCLDVIDDSAKKIGAVNTVVFRDGVKTGYNTDFDGMRYMFSRAGIELLGKKVLILGSGGTSNTSVAVAKYLGARKVIVVSRSGENNYENLDRHFDADVIINTTPVGMYPNNYQSPIDLAPFKNLSGVADAIYNPDTTYLTCQAKLMGVRYTNGLPMLVAQAKFAMEHFFNKKVSDDVIEKVLSTLSKETLNVVLVGMPGSGKSTVGKAVADALNREFIDTDQEIVNRDGRDIPTIFKESGEDYFRALEKQVLKDVGKLTGKVIATGGGVIKDKENYFPLKSNGKIFWIKRDIESLVTDGRPLSKDLETVKKLFEERKDKYAAFADFVIDNDKDLVSAVEGVIEKL
ncbi:MAG: hypothetical protein IJV95_02470 [Clostridia bacterium]|nr:hypothetical protein [Clostridia bacterium]